MNWRTKRRKDREAQEAYFEDHPYCEVCLAEGRGTQLAEEIHEIIYRSQGGKCVPENEISVCRPDHGRAHFLVEPYLHREDLYKMKEGRQMAEEENMVVLNEKEHKEYYGVQV